MSQNIKGLPLFDFQFSVKSLIEPANVQLFRKADWVKVEIICLNPEKFKGKLPYRMIFSGKLDTCSPSFQIKGNVEIKKQYVRLLSNSSLSYAKKDPLHICREDVQHFIYELENPQEAQRLFELPFPYPVEKFEKDPLFEEIKGKCDYFRVDLERPLKNLFGPKQYSKIRQLSGEKLQELDRIRRETFWELWFETTTKQFGLKEVKHECPQNLPESWKATFRIYRFLKEEHDNGHELFYFPDFLRDYEKVWFPRGYNDSKYYDPALYNLTRRVLCKMQDKPIYCLKKDLLVTGDVLDSLASLDRQAFRVPPERELFVPCKSDKTLTDIQQAFVKHVYRNKLTFLLGAPGTGKTMCLEAIMAAFCAPLVVTYVGMMVDALQQRFGGRPETANTIHYVACVAEFVETGPKWLEKFDLLVIDEGSNVDIRLFRRILAVTPNCCRIVIAGDLNQIFPVKPGSPFYDLVHIFPQHCFKLDKNQRVDPDSLELARASEAIARGEMPKFEGALQRIDLPPSEREQKELLRSILLEFVKNSAGIMKMQIVTLRNADRKMLNRWTEEILLEQKILSDKYQVNVGGIQYYPGKKTMFTKNNKKLCIRNGELQQVKSVDDKFVFCSGKVVSIGLPTGLDPMHIQPGFATTCNKAQGSEWEKILFWIYPNPNPAFTREYAYVAISRAKKACTVVGLEEDFAQLCRYQAKERRTLLRFHLQNDLVLEDLAKVVEFDDVVLQDMRMVKLMDPKIPAVPLLEEEDEDEKKKKKSRK